MPTAHVLRLNTAEWDTVARALLSAWQGPSRGAETYRLMRLLARMHGERPDTASRREADREIGHTYLRGGEAVKLPWDTAARFASRARQYGRPRRREG
jgi:hypothetical protein